MPIRYKQTEPGNRLGRALARSHATEFAGYLDAACRAATGKSSPPEDPLNKSRLKAALQGGVRYLCAVPDTPRVLYHEIYVQVVQSVADELYQLFSTGTNSALDSLPGDVLIAARQMSIEVADLVYRADIQSILAKHLRKRRKRQTTSRKRL